jgi:hypothetical protein
MTKEFIAHEFDTDYLSANPDFTFCQHIASFAKAVVLNFRNT